MKKIFKKGTDVEGMMYSPIYDWIEENIGKFQDEKGLLKKNITIEIKKSLT